MSYREDYQGIKMEKCEKSLVYRVAYHFYIEGLSQKQVALKLGLSTPKVCRLIRQAKKEGIIKISLQDPFVHYFNLERKICEKYKLKDVVVARVTKEAPPHLLKKAIAAEGAEYLHRAAKAGSFIGIAWGSTVYELVEAMDPINDMDVGWVALHGSLSRIQYEHDVATLVRKLAWLFSGKGYYLNIEGILVNDATCEAIKKEPFVRATIEIQKEIKIAVVGIGAFFPKVTSTLVSAGYISDEDLTELRKEGVVGDIALHFFDASGRFCSTSLSKRIISIDPEVFKKIPLKIGVAGSLSKFVAIRSAIQGGLVDVLITDPLVAERLLLERRDENK